MSATTRPMLPHAARALGAVLACAAWPVLGAQAPSACALMPSAEVATLIGRRFHDDPDPTTLAGGAGSACTYGTGNAQVVVFSGPRSRQLWDNYLRNFKKDKEARQPVPAAGAGAYVIYPTPRDQYEDTIGLLVVTSGAHTVGVSVAAETGQPAASVQPALVALARAVVAKLR